mgnify:FL=1
MTTRPPPLPAVIVRDDRPVLAASSTADTDVSVGYVRGHRCTLCDAWAASFVRLRHVDGCKGADCG